MFVRAGVGTETYDCFIVGSGPAGLTAGLALADAGKRALIFESGDDGATRNDLAACIGYGHYAGSYWNGHSIRTLGGTSAVWSGWCTALSALDLDNPAVGVRWPITKEELAPYWRRAAPLVDHHPDFIDFEAPLLPGLIYRPIPTATPTHFGRKFQSAMQTHPRLGVATGATVVGLDANEARSTVTRIEYLDHRTGARRVMAVRPAQAVVLAAGGIGNAQLLLQPHASGGTPVGNETGHVGECLMEHPHFSSAGECAIDAELDRYWPRENTGPGMHAIVADRTLSLEHGLYGCSLQCARKTADHDVARFLSGEAGRPFFHYEITARAEMLPSPANRVFVTAERDAAGLLRPAARCVLDARDLLNVEMTLRTIGERLMRQGRGRIRVNNDRIYKVADGGGHIMGTTRMGDVASGSVVDRDCRVHGYANLFVAGSSVFPSGGYANPTLTIVALALRLADTLAARGPSS
jgi:choline dehydrogenase-like flavoprotein